ncbi:hypothetical protein HMPREF2141_00195 [Bacteroides uniformis]|nr:hypothetical protein HMPREF2141_00195 [Bacteroides uniformis]
MGFIFNPIKTKGEWVLTIKDGRQPSRESATHSMTMHLHLSRSL